MADYTDDITLSVGYQDTVDGTLAYTGSVTSTNGEQISVTPKTTGGDAVVSNGVQIVPEGGAIIHLKNSTGSNIAIVGEKAYPVTNSTGSQINVDGASTLDNIIFTETGQTKPRITQTSKNNYTIWILPSERDVPIHVSSSPGEPVLDSMTIIDQTADDSGASPEDSSVVLPNSGHPDFVLNPRKLGTTVFRVSPFSDGEVTAQHAWLTVMVIEEPPQTVYVHGGLNTTFDYSVEITDSIMGDDADNVMVTSYAVFSGDIHVDQGNAVEPVQIHDIAVAHGAQIAVEGGAQFATDEYVRHAGTISLDGSVVWSGDIVVSNGLQDEVVPGHVLNVSGGWGECIYGWKEASNTVTVVAGSNIQIQNSVVLTGDIVCSTGARIQLIGQKPVDLVISHHASTGLFRGEQVEQDDIIVSNGFNIVLTGTSQGGTITDVAVPCKIYQASTVPNRCFVLGKIEEID